MSLDFNLIVAPVPVNPHVKTQCDRPTTETTATTGNGGAAAATTQMWLPATQVVGTYRHSFKGRISFLNKNMKALTHSLLRFSTLSGAHYYDTLKIVVK